MNPWHVVSYYSADVLAKQFINRWGTRQRCSRYPRAWCFASPGQATTAIRSSVGTIRPAGEEHNTRELESRRRYPEPAHRQRGAWAGLGSARRSARCCGFAPRYMAEVERSRTSESRRPPLAPLSKGSARRYARKWSPSGRWRFCERLAQNVSILKTESGEVDTGSGAGCEGERTLLFEDDMGHGAPGNSTVTVPSRRTSHGRKSRTDH